MAFIYTGLANPYYGFNNNGSSGLVGTSTSPWTMDDYLQNSNPYNNTVSDPNMANSGSNIAGYIGAGAGVLQGLSGLASAYTAYKGLQLAKDQFKYQKVLANKNLANQAKIINNSYDNAAQVAAGMIGGRNADGSFGMTSQDIVNKYTNRAKEKYVDGSPI